MGCWKIFLARDVIYRVLFTKDGTLEIQETLHRYLQVSWKQTTLDNWLSEDKEVYETQRTSINKTVFEESQAITAKQLDRNDDISGEYKREKPVYTEGFLDHWDDTICNIELDMRHDKNGNVKGWMEGEPTTDEWDGSVDNKIKNLEDHVGKRGWLF